MTASTGFLPPDDLSQTQVHIALPPGTPFEETLATAEHARRLVQAHKLHHAVQTKEGAVSFGFVFAPDPHKLRAKLKAMRAARKTDA